MQYTRWYDKDNRLKFIVNILEKLDEETRNFFAADIIQILINSKYPETDEFIENIGNDNIISSDRWYDKNNDVHSAVEMLKYADTDDKKELVNEFLYSIANMKGMVSDILSNTEPPIKQQKITNSVPFLSYPFSEVKHFQTHNFKKIME